MYVPADWVMCKAPLTHIIVHCATFLAMVALGTPVMYMFGVLPLE